MVCAMLALDFPLGKRRQSVYQFSVHAPNIESLIKRFIFRFKGIFSVLPIRTNDMRLSSDTRHFPVRYIYLGTITMINNWYLTGIFFTKDFSVSYHVFP